METTEPSCILLDIGPPVLQRVMDPFNCIRPIVVIIIRDSSPIRLHGLVHLDNRVLAHIKVSGVQCLIFNWSEVFVTLRYTLPLALRLGCHRMGKSILILGTLEIKWTIISPSDITDNITLINT
jgi:hypothetical protein